eukprot:jgi/Mesvir1/29634/Mv21484-RA.1
MKTPEGPPSLLLKASVQGFKSITNAQFNFKKGFNLIVGANGCGKSNLLEAICFALGEDRSQLRVSSLSQLQSSDKQGCPGIEVTLDILEVATKETHKLTAKLSFEAQDEAWSTSYSLNGKAKTRREVRAFLARTGMALPACAVLHQSRVTQLADANDPGVLASVVRAASGGDVWDGEVRTAVEELRRMESALAGISANIRQLEGDIGANEAKIQASRRVLEVDHALSEGARALLAYQAAAQRDATRSLDTLQARAQEAHAQQERARDRAVALQQEMDKLAQQVGEKQASLRAALDDMPAQLARILPDKERLALAAVERREVGDRLASLGARLASMERELREKQAALVVHEGTVLRRLEAELKKVEGGPRGGGRQGKQEDSLGWLKHALSTTRAELAAEEAKGASCRQAATAAQGLIASLEHTLQDKESEGRHRLAEAHQQAVEGMRACLPDTARMWEDAKGGVPSLESLRQMLAAARAHAAEKADALANVGKRRMQLSMQHTRLRSTTALLSSEEGAMGRGGGQGGAEGGAGMGEGAGGCLLHECFTLKPEYGGRNAQEYLTAMGVIAGSSLNISVVPTTDAATRLLARWERDKGGGGQGPLGSSRRIWVLERLRHTAADRERACQQWRETAAGVGPWDVVFPLDLLHVTRQGYEAAVARAFGGMVITRNDAVGQRACVEGKLSNVTLQGVVHKAGSVQGGWRGAAGAPTPMRHKWESDELAREEFATMASLQQLQQELDRARVLQSKLQQSVDALEAITGATEQVTAQLAAARAELVSAEASAAAAETSTGALRAKQGELADTWRQVAAHKDGDDAADAVAAALRNHHSKALGEREAMQSAIDRLMFDIEDVGEKRKAMNERCDDTCPDALEEELRQLAAREQQLHEQAANQAAAADQETKLLQGRLEALHEERASLAVVKKEAARVGAGHKAAVQEAQRRVTCASREMDAIHKLFEAHLAPRARRQRSENDPGAGDAAASSADAPPGEPSEATEGAPPPANAGISSLPDDVAYAAEKRRLQGLQAERAGHLAQGRLSAAEHALFEERRRQLVRFQEQSGTLHAAIHKLRQGIRVSQQKVHDADETAFHAIRGRFTTLAAQLLPNKRLDLVKVANTRTSRQGGGEKGKPGEPASHAKGRGSTGRGGPGGAIAPGTEGGGDEKGGSEDGEGEKPVGDGPTGGCHVADGVRVVMLRGGEGGKGGGGVGGRGKGGGGEENGREGGAGGREEEGEKEGGIAGAEYQSSMQELSGGQRTMVSLALLLAAATSATNSLYILDEADAALDEVNQQRVGALVRQHVARSAQVLCISHNKAFQQFADHTLQLRKKDGATVCA